MTGRSRLESPSFPNPQTAYLLLTCSLRPILTRRGPEKRRIRRVGPMVPLVSRRGRSGTFRLKISGEVDSGRQKKKFFFFF